MILGRRRRCVARCGMRRACENPAMGIDRNRRDLEDGIHTDLDGRLTYGGYLRLDRLLSAQQPLSQPSRRSFSRIRIWN